MLTKSIVCLLLLVSMTFAQTEQHEAMFFTGNPTVDFFGSSLKSNSSLENNPPLLFQEEERGLTGEKSPWLAVLFSLAVPGAGEVYTESYVKAALFFAVEATSWSLAYSYNKKGNNQTAAYQDYANQHWSAVRYVNWTIDHLNQLNSNIPNDQQYYIDRIYSNWGGADDRPTPDECGPPFDCINWPGLNEMERAVANGVTNGYTHTLPYYGEQQYYELIGKYDQFYSGWDDANPTLNPSDYDPPSDSRFVQYSRMRADANAQYDVASTWVKVALINHILSAIDAYWSATQYNRSLHAEVKTKVIPTQLGMIPVPELRVRYEF